MCLINYIHLPSPYFIEKEMGVSHTIANKIHAIARCNSREELHNKVTPKASKIAYSLSDLELIMFTISEVLKSTGIKLIKNLGESDVGVFYHIIMPTAEECSFGYNTLTKRFYLKSENECLVSQLR